mgnify:CR=1 FL=1
MPDDFERAAEYEEIDRTAAISMARRPVAGLAFTGACHFCLEPVAEPQRFCDGDCASDHERMVASVRRNGRNV